MERKLIELFESLLFNPLTELFRLFGFNEIFSKVLSTAVILLMFWLIGLGLKKLLQHLKNNKTARELVHFRYSYKDVKQKHDLFIPTKGQNNSPTYEDEPQRGKKFIVKQLLIPFFIETVIRVY